MAMEEKKEIISKPALFWSNFLAKRDAHTLAGI